MIHFSLDIYTLIAYVVPTLTQGEYKMNPKYIFTWPDGSYTDPMSFPEASELLKHFPDGRIEELEMPLYQFEELLASERMYDDCV